MATYYQRRADRGLPPWMARCKHKYIGYFNSRDEATDAEANAFLKAHELLGEDRRCFTSRGRKRPEYRVDEELNEAASLISWYEDEGYVKASIGGQTVRMHDWVIEMTDGVRFEIVDHINRNRLDNASDQRSATADETTTRRRHRGSAASRG
jgi:hypothetical protein